MLGAALIAIPMSRLMAARGRRPGLVLGYVPRGRRCRRAGHRRRRRQLPAAARGERALRWRHHVEQPEPLRRSRPRAAEPPRAGPLIVVWATTVGSVLGPNLVGPSAPVADALGLPALTGPYVFSLVGLLLAIAVILLRLRPDPLVEARRRSIADGERRRPGARVGDRVACGSSPASPPPASGMATLALGHVSMVSVMVMTPLHMSHGDAGLEVIGFVISIHILGMFAFSPLTGMAVDRFGGRAVAVLGSVVLSSATLLASASPEGDSVHCSSRALPPRPRVVLHARRGVDAAHRGASRAAERPGAQGASDLRHGPHGRRSAERSPESSSTGRASTRWPSCLAGVAVRRSGSAAALTARTRRPAIRGVSRRPARPPTHPAA